MEESDGALLKPENSTTARRRTRPLQTEVGRHLSSLYLCPAVSSRGVGVLTLGARNMAERRLRRTKSDNTFAPFTKSGADPPRS